MSIFVPIILVGAMASAAWALDSSPAVTGPSHPPIAQTAPLGMGAYLRGAVADLGGAPSTALEGYLQALSDDPDNMDLRQRTLELALMSGDIPNAIRLTRTLPEIEQTTITRLVQLADDAHEGRIPAASKSAQEVTKVSPELLQFRLLKAYLDYAKGEKVNKLVPWLEKTPMPNALTGRRYYHEARLLLKDGQPQKALELLQKAHKAEPSALTSTLLLGQVLARQGQPDAGAAVYEIFRAENPALALLIPSGSSLLNAQPEPFASTLDDDLAATFADFGLLIWSQGAIGPARQVLNLALWLNPQDAYTRYYSALLLEMGNDLPTAEAEYTRLLQSGIHPDFRLAVQIRMAEVQYRSGKEKEAYQSLKDLSAKHPNTITLQRSLAQMAFAQDDFTQSAESYSRILGTLPTGTPDDAKVELLFARGAAYERAGNVADATKDLQLALTLAPTNASVMNYLGYMWVDKNMNIPEAFALLQKAHLLQPDDGAVTDSLGWAYFKQGDYETAANYLALATEQDPESPEIYDHLGDAYAKLGRKEDAQREWQRALDLLEAGKPSPSDDFAPSVKKKLR